MPYPRLSTPNLSINDSFSTFYEDTFISLADEIVIDKNKDKKQKEKSKVIMFAI